MAAVDIVLPDGTVIYRDPISDLLHSQDRCKITNPLRDGAVPKVAFLNPVFGMGGTERWLYSVIPWLTDNRRAECEVVVLAGGRRDEGRTLENVCPIVEIPVEDVQAYLETNGFNLALSWGMQNIRSVVGSFRPNVVCVHGSDASYTAGYAKAAQRLVSQYVAVSNAAMRPFVVAEIPLDMVEVIHNGVDPERVKATVPGVETKKLLGISAEQRVVTYIGRLANEKRLDTLVRAVNSLSNRYRAIIMGNGPSLGTLKGLDKSGRCVFLPGGYEIGNVLAASDCFYGGSGDEGFWYGGAEASLAGVPLVTTRVGFVTEVPRDRDLYVEIRKNAYPSEVAAAIVQACNRRPDTKRMAEIVGKWTVGEMSRKWADVVSVATGSVIPGGPSVSILLSVWNTAPRMLRECWESIKAQTCKDWELVLVDDASDADTAKEIDSIASDSRVRLFRFDKHAGIAVSKNLGLRKCRSEFVAIMDADDVMLPERLEVQLAYMASYPEIDVLGAQLEVFDDVTGEVARWEDRQEVVDMSVVRDQQGKREGVWLMNHPTTMFRKSRVLALGAYPDDYACCIDLALWIRLLKAGCVLRNTPEKLVRYRLHGKQVSKNSEHVLAYERVLRSELSNLVVDRAPRVLRGARK